MTLFLLFSLLAFQPFNSATTYPGDQAGKGTVESTNGCLTAGNTLLDASGNMQVLFSQVSETGQVLWTDSIHWGNSSEILGIFGLDSLLIMTGSSSDPSTSEDALVWALTDDCQDLWAFSLDLPLQERFTSATSGNGLVLCAGSSNSIGAGGNDVLMVALDDLGREQWQKTYGTPGEEAAYHVSSCADGGFVMACQAMDWGAGLGDYWIVRTDANGDTLWTTTCGGPEFDYPWRVMEYQGSFYVAGNTLSYGEGSYDWWIVRLDSAGNVLWTKSWGYEHTDTCMALEVTGNGILAGGISEPVLNQVQATVVTFDTDGNVIDEWFYQPGMIRSIESVGDYFLLGGTAYSTGADLWTLCIDSDGYAPQMGTGPENDDSGSISLSSNPAFGALAITLPPGIHTLEIRDLSGRIAVPAASYEGEFIIDTSGFPAGIYTISIEHGNFRRFAVLN